MTTSTDFHTATTRYFGNCMSNGCKYRNVREFTRNEAIRECSNGRCPECNVLMKYRALEGKFNPAKECNGRCMASRGPSCSCACGGENHGTNHL